MLGFEVSGFPGVGLGFGSRDILVRLIKTYVTIQYFLLIVATLMFHSVDVGYKWKCKYM